MIRLMRPEDLPAMVALWQEAFGTEDHAEQVICRFSGEKNAWVDERDGTIAAMALTPPVRIGAHKGVYLCGLATKKEWQGKGLATAMVAQICSLLGQAGAEFAALIPEQDGLRAFYEKQGFVNAFARRAVEKPLRRNLWSRAEFDAVPAKTLGDVRVKFCPNVVQLRSEAMVYTMTELYARGATVVSNDNGYGIYFREGDCLRFVELMAENDRAANCILEAAREREVIAERAVFSVNAGQNLFVGEGRRYEHGMIRFLAQPFEIEDSYLGLALDV